MKKIIYLTIITLILNCDAKLRRVWVISKYLGQIFLELLRRGGRDATKGAQRAKSCRMSK